MRGGHGLRRLLAFAPVIGEFERKALPIAAIRRGDVVVFKSPVEPDRDLIKRVIGLPGEILEQKNKKIFINGAPLDPARQYAVGISDFLMTGGETNLGYLTRTNPGVHDVTELRDVRRAVMDELKSLYK